jgi:Arc/MetJ-type ribon-helix-helix transcriptional regulator
MPRGPQALPTGLVRLNVIVQRRRAAEFDFLRLHTESSSDSEVTRQSLRYFEQFVNDADNGIKLKSVAEDEMVTWWSPDDFKDLKWSQDTERRNLVVHDRTVNRLRRMLHVMEVESFSEIIRAALRFYLRLVHLNNGHTRFFAVHSNGQEFPLRLYPYFR